MKRIELLLQKIWLDYIDLNPSVKKIYDLFAQNNEGGPRYGRTLTPLKEKRFTSPFGFSFGESQGAKQ